MKQSLSMTVRKILQPFACGAIVFGLAMLAAACGKKDKFVYYAPQKDLDVHFTKAVKEIQGGSGDILWVIDNSGSMATHQQNVINNTALFMQDFIKYFLDWKMGLVSTAVSEPPYIGFTPTDLLNRNTPDPIGKFQKAVRNLGISGDGEERTFDPILAHLKKYPDFLRPDAPLAILIVTDATEQSNVDFKAFLPAFKKLIGEGRKYFVYSVTAANDLSRGCPPDAGAWNYAGSRYEEFAKSATIGRAFSLCAADFGGNLAKIGKEIAEQILRPSIYLDTRPKISTLQVSFRGTPLPAGSREDGGIWFYDYELNSVIFYSLDFAQGDTEHVDISYESDDGLPPGTLSHSTRKESVGVQSLSAIEPEASPLPSPSVSPSPVPTHTPVPAGWTEYPIQIETEHPYPIGRTSLMRTVHIEGAKALKFHFTRVNMKNSADFVSFYEGEKPAALFSLRGEAIDVWTQPVSGEMARILFTTDTTGTDWGFQIDLVQARF